MTSREATLAVIGVLESLGIPYMVVGALSSNFYGIARSSKDADFVVQLGERPITDIVRELGPSFVLDPQITFETATGTTRHIVSIEGLQFQIEFFRLSEDPHDQERFRRRVRVQLPEVQAWVLTAEDVIVTKLRWAVYGGRAKDAEDARGVIAVQRDRIDWPYVRLWCGQHGTLQKLDEIRRSIPPI